MRFNYFPILKASQCIQIKISGKLIVNIQSKNNWLVIYSSKQNISTTLIDLFILICYDILFETFKDNPNNMMARFCEQFSRQIHNVINSVQSLHIVKYKA